MATTSSPTRRASDEPSSAGTRSVDAPAPGSMRDVVVGEAARPASPVLAAVGEHDGDVADAADHVGVGEDEAVGGEDDAGAGALEGARLRSCRSSRWRRPTAGPWRGSPGCRGLPSLVVAGGDAGPIGGRRASSSRRDVTPVADQRGDQPAGQGAEQRRPGAGWCRAAAGVAAPDRRRREAAGGARAGARPARAARAAAARQRCARRCGRRAGPTPAAVGLGGLVVAVGRLEVGGSHAPILARVAGLPRAKRRLTGTSQVRLQAVAREPIGAALRSTRAAPRRKAGMPMDTDTSGWREGTARAPRPRVLPERRRRRRDRPPDLCHLPGEGAVPRVRARATASITASGVAAPSGSAAAS